MSPFLPASALLAPLLVPFLALSGDPTTAEGAFQVSPNHVAIAAGTKVRQVTVKNDGEQPVRLRVLPQSWSQTLRGDPELTATSALVSTPSALTLAAGESRQVSLVPTRASGALEQAFRIVLEEVDAEGHATGAAPRSVPVFIEPRVARAEPVLATSLLSYRTLSFSIGNEGSAHFIATRVQVVAKSEAGERVFSAELPASYVLAGSRRGYGLDLPEAACRAASVEVQVETGRDRFVFPFGRLRCSS